MALHLQDQGTWKKAEEVWVKDADTWKLCNEVYIKENNVWKPVLYEPGSFYDTENGLFTIPGGVYSVTVSISGGAGGAGGGDGGAGGVNGGNALTATTTVEVLPGDRFEYIIGKKGGDGVGYQNRAAGGNGGNGYSNGGNGGQAGNQGSSGGGGGGGGSSLLRFYAVTYGWDSRLIVAAGGSGAGGRGNNVHYSTSQIHGKNATTIQSTDYAGENGGNGISCPCADGGAGGGGGGGTWPVAAGGLYYNGYTTCVSGYYDSDGSPGEAGTSYYSPQISVSTESNNTGDGYVSISW